MCEISLGISPEIFSQLLTDVLSIDCKKVKNSAIGGPFLKNTGMVIYSAGIRIHIDD